MEWLLTDEEMLEHFNECDTAEDFRRFFGDLFLRTVGSIPSRLRESLIYCFIVHHHALQGIPGAHEAIRDIIAEME